MPRGRGKRERPLSDKEVAAALMGMVPVEPGWAGHAAAILENLKPVGGDANGFASAPTLSAAIAGILADESARKSLVSLRMSVAESGTNSNGSAVILCERDGTRRQTFYVPREAVSLFQPGAEAHFDAERRHAEFSREVVFNRCFFEQLARKVEQDRSFPRPPAGDGAEYDAEEAEQARRLRLGACPSSRFLNIGVDNQVDWPLAETLVHFDKYKLVLMPKTKDHMQSVHIDLQGNRLSSEEALTVINRFLSLLTWCDDQYAVAQDGWSGNPVPVAVPKRNLAFTTTYHWIFNRSIPASEDAQRALALYREGRNAEQNFMIGYAVLSYFKVLEIRYPEGKFIKPWIAQNFPLIRTGKNDPRVDALLNACGAEAVEDYLWKACRVAVAHVREKHPSDPDSAVELQRLHNAAGITRRLARHFIKTELGVSDSPVEPAPSQP